MPQSLNNLGGTILIFPVGGSMCQMKIVGVNCSLCLPPMSLALIQVLRSALDVDVLRCGVGSWKLIPLLSVSMRRTIPPSEVMGIGPLLEPKETVSISFSNNFSIQCCHEMNVQSVRLLRSFCTVAHGRGVQRRTLCVYGAPISEGSCLSAWPWFALGIACPGTGPNRERSRGQPCREDAGGWGEMG